MEKFDELLKTLNDLQILQKQSDWAENLPDEIWKEHFQNNFTSIKTGLDVYTHRWYECSTDVIKIYDRFMGIKYLTNSFSESQSIEDCFVHIKFFEMEEFQTVSYKQKFLTPKH